MTKKAGRKPKRERTTRRRTRRHSSTSESSSEDVAPTPPPKTAAKATPKTATKTRASSRVNEAEKKVALTIKLPKPSEGNVGGVEEENTTGMWKVECSNGSDGDIQKLKISLRRSPKDLLREQAAEEKRKEKEAAGSSTHADSPALDGSVTNYLEQFGSDVAVEETVQNVVDSSEQVQALIPENEILCIQKHITPLENDEIDSSETSFKPQEEPSAVDNISTDDNKQTNEVISESICKTDETPEEIKDPTTLAIESIIPFTNSPDDIPEPIHDPIVECAISETVVEDKLTNISELVTSDVTAIACSDNTEVGSSDAVEIASSDFVEIASSDVVEIVSSKVTETASSNVDIPIVLSENIQNTKPACLETIMSESNTTEAIEESVSIVEMKKTDDPILDCNKTDTMNDSEQMEDVVQLTVESPDLVDDEDPKPLEEEESKSLEDESIEHTKNQETKTVEEPDLLDSKQADIEKEFKSDKTLISLSSHPKRKWGSCKTRTPISISPFTLGVIINSNGDSIGDNGEYRSEEGEIQKTDSDDEQQNIDEPMEVNDTLLIDHEAVDYEAPDEEEKQDNDHDESKSDKSLTEEIIEEEPKKKSSSVKRTTSTNVIRITNLVRPFTVGQLRDLLQRTGKIVPNGFWIDTIKSQCIVEYENEDQAIETVYALNESQWPSTNPKFLRVVFTNKEELTKALSGTHPDRLMKPKEPSKVEKLRTQLDNHIILREWDRGKLEDMNGEKEGDKPIKRKITIDPNGPKDKKAKKDEKDPLDKHKKSKSKSPERIPTKSLDELFRKTKTTPTLYWSPLTIEQITEKEDQRRKHLAEMERSQKPDRRRRDINHYSRRR